jgi:hypothetical protein
MKITNKLLVIALSAAALGTTAYGATETAKAEIPFAFHTAGTALPAGSYEVTRNFAGINGMIRMQNAVTRKAAIVMGISDEAPSTNVTVLRFSCSDGCELVGVRSRDNWVTIEPHRKAWRQTAVIEVPVSIATGN